MEVLDLGIAGYEEVLETQKALLNERIAGEIPDTLILVEHHPVVTFGRLSREDSIDRMFFDEKGIPVLRSGRGGKNTFHSPGQLVLYPIVDLGGKKRDIALYIDLLEKTVANALNRLDVPAVRSREKRGVWAGGKKIAFIGIAVKKWVTFHGVAVNMNNDITPFLHMHPCGESDIRVTSAKELLGREVDMREAKRVFSQQLEKDLEIFYGIKTAGVV